MHGKPFFVPQMQSRTTTAIAEITANMTPRRLQHEWATKHTASNIVGQMLEQLCPPAAVPTALPCGPPADTCAPTEVRRPDTLTCMMRASSMAPTASKRVATQVQLPPPVCRTINLMLWALDAYGFKVMRRAGAAASAAEQLATPMVKSAATRPVLTATTCASPKPCSASNGVTSALTICPVATLVTKVASSARASTRSSVVCRCSRGQARKRVAPLAPGCWRPSSTAPLQKPLTR
mmetsp:Transcript_27357/g.78811  ORF Transcript_27357/g.78811 Transcript_27357/m.78811 type:complete len:236 (-) Transcript_27357:1160-1867(-)